MQNNIGISPSPGTISRQTVSTQSAEGSQTSANMGQFATNLFPRLNSSLFQNLFQIILQLLSALLQVNQPKDPPRLNLSEAQESKLKSLLGINPSAPFTVSVLDNNGDGEVSAGDTAIVNGGITGGVLTQRTLSESDAQAINQAKALPQAFTDNRAKWEAALQNSDGQIEYTRQQSCFCLYDVVRPMNVTEQNGEIIAANYADTGEAVPENIRENLASVSDIFDRLYNAYQSNAERIDVSYDPDYGYPSSVYIDQSSMIADEEMSYRISDMKI